MKAIIDYIWLDGKTLSDVRFITKVLDIDIKHSEFNGYFGKVPRTLNEDGDESKIPSITFDGNLTDQAPENGEGTTLKPVKIYRNPLKVNSFYVLCEVYDAEQPHKTNSRFPLSLLLSPELVDQLPAISLSQKFTIFKKWEYLSNYNEITEHHNQVYKSDGNNLMGEKVIDNFINHAITMNLAIDEVINRYNKNSIWEVTTSNGNPLSLADDLLIMRHLLYRLCEKYNFKTTFSRRYYTIIEDEKDKINDPYLLTRKIVKSHIG